jgi:pumilio RNA-binding family
MKSMGINQAQDHQNGITLPHNQHDSYLHAQQNAFEQQQGVQYYNTHQRDGSIPMHVQPNAMHPQVIQSNGTVNPPIFVSPAYGGYTTVQYHQPPYGQVINPVVHPHGADVKGRMSHPPQYVTAVPMQGGIPGQISAVPSNGTFIYFHQQGHAPAQTHPQTIAIVDANGHPTTITVPQNNRRNVNREQQIKTSPVLGSRGSDKSNRKSNRGSNKRVSTNSSLDSSRHSLSSGTLTLLEEYRSSKYKAWTAEDVKGHIVEFCQDQNGSRFIQQRLEVAKGSEMALITSEILSSVHILRNDVFGNYVVQKMFDHGSHEIIVALKESLKGQVVSLSSEMYGCRVVQKAMEKVDDEDLIDLLSEFHDTVLNCIHDQNGNHVIQKIIPVISSRSKTYQAEDKERAINFSKQLNFVLNCVIENIVPLSCHPFGCRVLQRILEHCIESQKSRALDAIQRCLRILLDDQYGNYVIQHVLQFGRKSDRDVVLQIVIENGILGLSRQKFASNVIEKLLKYGNGSHRNQVVREMLKVVDDRTVENGRCSIALLMVRDAYANYVVQTTLNVVPEGEEKELLLQDLRNNSAQLVSLYLSLIFLNLF